MPRDLLCTDSEPHDSLSLGPTTALLPKEWLCDPEHIPHHRITLPDPHRTTQSKEGNDRVDESTVSTTHSTKDGDISPRRVARLHCLVPTQTSSLDHDYGSRPTSPNTHLGVDEKTQRVRQEMTEVQI